MNNIFIGLLLAVLNFNLDIETMRIGLFPSFIGYGFMLKGVAEMSGVSGGCPRFTKLKPFVAIMAAASAAAYVMDLLGAARGWAGIAVGLASNGALLIIEFALISGIRELEKTKRGCSLEAGRLLTAWRVLAIVLPLCFLLMLIPKLAIFFVIAAFIVSTHFLIVFYRTKKLFNEWYATAR